MLEKKDYSEGICMIEKILENGVEGQEFENFTRSCYLSLA